MKIQYLVNRSSVTFILAIMVFAPICLGKDKQSDHAKPAPKQVEDIDAKLKKILGLTLNNLQETQKNLQEIQSVLHILTTNDTPIKVRGGAMTFVQKDKKWIRPTMGSICAELDDVTDLSTVVVEGFDRNVLPDGSISAVLPAKWTLKLYSGEPNHLHGVKLVSKQKKCDGTTAGASVTVSPFGGQNTTFYPADINSDPVFPGNKYYKRLYDPDCAAGVDEDKCERITGIAIIDQAASPSSPVFIPCPEMDCTVKIGKPQ